MATAIVLTLRDTRDRLTMPEKVVAALAASTAQNRARDAFLASPVSIGLAAGGTILALVGFARR